MTQPGWQDNNWQAPHGSQNPNVGYGTTYPVGQQNGAPSQGSYQAMSNQQATYGQTSQGYGQSFHQSQAPYPQDAYQSQMGSFVPNGLVDPVTGELLSDKSKIAAGLLQLFLGTFGVGRFYLGHNGIGLAQLLLTIFGWMTFVLFIGIPVVFAVGIWAFIDAILILTGAVRDGQGRKLRA